jgi:hypothetical protein
MNNLIALYVWMNMENVLKNEWHKHCKAHFLNTFLSKFWKIVELRELTSDLFSTMLVLYS